MRILVCHAIDGWFEFHGSTICDGRRRAGGGGVGRGVGISGCPLAVEDDVQRRSNV